MKETEAEVLNAHQPFHPFQLCSSASLTCLSFWAHTREGGHTIDASRARGAGGEGTVIDILTAVVPTPAPQELCFTLCVCARGINMLLLLDEVMGSSTGSLQPHLPQPRDPRMPCRRATALSREPSSPNPDDQVHRALTFKSKVKK